MIRTVAATSTNDRALPRSIVEALSDSGRRLNEVAMTAKYIAHLMTEIHGGEWRVRVDHATCFISVRQV